MAEQTKSPELTVPSIIEVLVVAMNIGSVVPTTSSSWRRRELLKHAHGENLPMLLGLADSASGGEDYVSDFKSGSLVTTFRFGETK
jgi:hypothetical protein